MFDARRSARQDEGEGVGLRLHAQHRLTDSLLLATAERWVVGLPARETAHGDEGLRRVEPRELRAPRFGRRRPFIVVGAALSTFGVIGCAFPPSTLTLRPAHSASSAASDSCAALALAANCSATAACLSDAVAASRLPAVRC